MKILVINGPNINMLGIREKNIYGSQTYDDLVNFIKKVANENDITVDIYQSNHEGDIVDKIQEAYYENYDGIIINPAAYTHTSIAILDALKAVTIPTIEVHISNINMRESFRKKSFITDVCMCTIMGLGFDVYKKALLFFNSHQELKNNS